MPQDETITSYSDRLVELAKRNIIERGGSVTTVNGKFVYRINREAPQNVERLPDLKSQYAAMRSGLRDEIEKGIVNGASAQEKARAAYLAICLDLAPELMPKYPAQWSKAVTALNAYKNVLQVIFFESPIPQGQKLAEKAVAAGVRKQDTSIKIWT